MMRVLHPFVLLIFPILVAALPLHDSGVVQDTAAPSKLAARFSFDPSFSRSVPSAADHSKEHNPAAPPQHPHALSGSLETSVLEKRNKIINPPTASFGWLPGFQGPTWPRANRDEMTEPTTEAAKTLATSAAAATAASSAELMERSAAAGNVGLKPVSLPCAHPIPVKPVQGFGWGPNFQGPSWPRSLLSSIFSSSAAAGDIEKRNSPHSGSICYSGKVAETTASEAVVPAAVGAASSSLTSIPTTRSIEGLIGSVDEPGQGFDPKSSKAVSAFPWGPDGSGAQWPRAVTHMVENAAKETQ